jgi:hypothetical protein
MPLFYTNMVPSSVSLAATMGDGAGTFTLGMDTPFFDTPFRSLMGGGIEGDLTLTLRGLVPSHTYELIFYAADDTDGDNVTTLEVNGLPQSAFWDGTDRVFSDGENVLRLPSVLSTVDGTLTIRSTGANGGGNLSGFQLRAVVLPEPGSACFGIAVPRSVRVCAPPGQLIADLRVGPCIPLPKVGPCAYRLPGNVQLRTLRCRAP